ncbi:MAG TPA: diguanylate cyclase [Planctomycetota bacterium]|nr:diguanylate cyclase [Planctomycetota bacterium]
MSDPGAPPTPIDDEPPVRRSRFTYGRFLVPLTLAIGLGVTGVVWKIVREWESQQLNVLLGDKVAEQVQKLDRETDDATDILLALRAHFAGSGAFDADNFGVFASEHLHSFPEVVAVGWLQRVRALERDEFEARVRPDNAGRFEILEANAAHELVRADRRDQYFPVTFVTPIGAPARNERSFGFDHGAIPERLAAIEEACRTGRMVVVGPTSYVAFAEGAAATTPGARAFVCYLPVFAGGGVPAIEAERDARLLGCVVELVDVEELFVSAARSMRLDTIALRVYVDEAFGAGGKRTFAWKSLDDGLDDDYDAVARSRAFDEHRLVFGSRCFRILARPNDQFASSAVVVPPWFAVLAALGFTGAATYLVYKLGSERGRLSREIRQFWKMTSEMLCVMDTEGHLRRVNPAWTALLGRSESDLIGTSLPELVHPEDRADSESALHHLSQGVTSVTFEARLRSGDAEWHWLRWNAAPSDDRKVVHAVASDVTNERSTIEQLEERASIDSLTGVLTRRALFDKLSAEFERARRYGSTLSVCVLDLDHFKQVNDRHGHVMGDALLRRLGQLLKKSLRTADCAGRFGGDEFVMVLPECDYDAGKQTAERLLVLLEDEGHVALPDGKSLKLKASLGVAELSADITDVAMLVARADASLYRAKRAGRSRVS